MSTASQQSRARSVAVRAFLETGRKPLRMELEAGEAGLSHKIREAAINRPGLAFSGFYTHFAHRRIQCMGLSEYAYLSSLDESLRRDRMRQFFEKRIPCLVIARHKRLFPEVHELAEEFRIPVMRTAMITKHFVNAATIIMENLMAPRMNIQGTTVEIMGIGVLIQGKPGMGKSETALALIRKGGSLVSDDITSIRVDSAGSVIASPVNVTRYHMEIRGLGIIHVPSLFGVASVRGEKKLNLVVTLCEPERLKSMDRSGEERATANLLGVDIPRIFVPVAPGRDLADVVETAALDEKLRQLGHDAAKELDERLMSTMSGGGVVSE